MWLVSLEDEPEIATAAPPADHSTGVDTALVQQLEHELKSTKEDLQRTIEDLRAANEELMSGAHDQRPWSVCEGEED